MKTDEVSSKSLDVEIKKLELQIAQLRLDFSEKQKELLEELQSTESLGIDWHEQPLREGDIAKILTPSRKGSFKGIYHAVVNGRSKWYTKRILIGKVDDLEVTTNRESYNLLVIKHKNDQS